MVSTPSRAATNGSTSSRLPPMPLNIRSGGVTPLPERMPTRSTCPSTSTLRISIPALDMVLTLLGGPPTGDHSDLPSPGRERIGHALLFGTQERPHLVEVFLDAFGQHGVGIGLG